MEKTGIQRLFSGILLVTGVLVWVIGVADSATGAEAQTKKKAGHYVDVRTYLPQDYVTDGSVDYKEHIQKCLDENTYVYFPGSNDHKNPMIYGSTAGLKTRPFAVVRFGTNAILKRLPCFGDMIRLGYGARLIGMVIDGNKYAHWPLVKDRPIEAYAYVIGNGIILSGRNVIEDCFVYNLAGIAFGCWDASDNKIYRSRAENCGFLEAMGDDFYSGEYASGDGFYFSGNSRNNIVKDSEAFDCSRWGFVLTEGTRDNTFVDLRGGNIHFKGYGFIDIEGAEYTNSLVRCKSNNSHITVMGSQNELTSCVASHINALNASYVRIIGCTTTGGPILVGGTPESLERDAKPSAMVLFNRVFMSRPYQGGGIRVASSDGKSIVANNTVYAYEYGEHRGKGLNLHNVAVNSGNQVSYGKWDKEIAQFGKPSYQRAYVDMEFLEQRKREKGQFRLNEYLPKMGIEDKPAYQQIIIGDHPFKWDEDNVGQEQRWYDPSMRPKDVEKNYIGRHWRTDHTLGPLPTGWHFVSFQLPAEHVGKQVFVQFGAIDGLADVYINGESMGTHNGNTEAGWNQPFHFDVTKYVKAGSNDLTVRISVNTMLGGPFRPISIVVK